MFNVHRTYELTTGVKNNTIAVLNSMVGVSVIYHKTIVLKYDREHDMVSIDNGGYDTVSTRLVINRGLKQIPGFLGYELKRDKNRTYIYKNGEKLREFTGYDELFPMFKRGKTV